MWDASTTPPASEPGSAGPLDDGIVLALTAEQDGDWKPVIDWLARHPSDASGLAEFLAAGERIKAVLPAPPGSARIPGLERLEEIGRSNGVVYRAHEPALKRDVAVKVMPIRGEEDRARFRNEALAVARLQHPNVLPVLSFGEAGGVPYLVMPLMPCSLAGWLRDRGPDRLLAPALAAEIVRGIALGTHHAHQRGLIHRDLKPGNVLLDDAGVPLIADFGLARPVDISVSGGVAGTPAYMAPEQARGEKRLTPAVDVHALGVILFELLAGRTPFGGHDTFSTLQQILEEQPPPLRSIRADVPADLESICRRCLEKRPEDRYPSAQAVAEDLGRFLAGERPAYGQAGGVLDDIGRAVGRLVPTRGIGTWPLVFFGAASSTLCLGAMQAAVLLDAPAWAPWAALACYFVGWFVIVGGVAVRHRHALNAVERGSQVIQFGMKFAALATLPAQAWLHGGAAAPAVAPLFAIVGLGLFIGGGTFWGRLYVVGLLQLLVGALLPLVPVKLWPGLYCLTQLVVQVWFGLQVWRIDREGRREAAPPA